MKLVIVDGPAICAPSEGDIEHRKPKAKCFPPSQTLDRSLTALRLCEPRTNTTLTHMHALTGQYAFTAALHYYLPAHAILPIAYKC